MLIMLTVWMQDFYRLLADYCPSKSDVRLFIAMVIDCNFLSAHTCAIHVTLNRPMWTCYNLDCFYRASICEGGLGSRNSVCVSVRLSVCLSVTRVDCDKTKWRTADIFIPHERAITLLLWYQQWLVGDAPFSLKSAFKVTHPLRKTPTSTDFRS